MRTLDFYIGQTILRYALVVLAVLLGLFLFVTFIDQLGDLGRGNYGAVAVARFVLLSAPRIIYELFPMAALLGAILGLSLLAADSELIVMRASGISLRQILGSVLKVGAIFVVFAVVMGELVSPVSETMAQRGRAEALQYNVRQGTNFGLWMRDTHTYVNIGEVLPDLTLLRVRVFEFDSEERLRSLVYASRGRFQDGRWKLESVRQTVIGDDGFTEVNILLDAVWQTQVTPQIMSVFLVRPDELSLWQLKRYISHLRENSQDTDPYELAFWTKLVLPLSTAVMVVLAIPFVFGNLRAGTMGRNLFFGIMLGLLFYVAGKAFGYIVLVYSVPPFLGATIPVVAFLLLALLMFRRVT